VAQVRGPGETLLNSRRRRRRPPPVTSRSCGGFRLLATGASTAIRTARSRDRAVYGRPRARLRSVAWTRPCAWGRTDDLGRRSRHPTAPRGMTCPRLSNSPPVFPQIRARLALPTDGRPQQDSNLRALLRRPKPSKSWTCTDLPVEPLSGRDRAWPGACAEVLPTRRVCRRRTRPPRKPSGGPGEPDGIRPHFQACRAEGHRRACSRQRRRTDGSGSGVVQLGRTGSRRTSPRDHRA
jgi:hypothetical protein